MNYIVQCENFNESIKVQKILFINGIYWDTETGDDKDRLVGDEDCNWLRVTDKLILACGEPHSYLNNKYSHVDMNIYKFISATKFLRKIKLNKLKSV